MASGVEGVQVNSLAQNWLELNANLAKTKTSYGCIQQLQID